MTDFPASDDVPATRMPDGPVRSEGADESTRPSCRMREAALEFHRGYTANEERAGGRDLGFFVLHPERD